MSIKIAGLTIADYRRGIHPNVVHIDIHYNAPKGFYKGRFPNVNSLSISLNSFVLRAPPLPLDEFQGLTNIHFNDFTYQDLSSLSEFTNLEKITIAGARHLTSLRGIETLRRLEILCIRDSPFLTDISQLEEGFPNLEILKLIPVSSLQDWNRMSARSFMDRGGVGVPFPNLKKLSLTNLSMCSFEWTSGCPNLESLRMEHCCLDDISGISELPKLTDFVATHCQLKNLHGIEWLASLKHLDISFNDVSDITPILHLPEIEQLNISDNPLKMELETLPRTVKRLTGVSAQFFSSSGQNITLGTVGSFLSHGAVADIRGLEK